ncbi:hypothetical protein FIA58_014005 [Flavobacterium jejuense]|uniref:Integrase catalytic domain-containing protein n=1 Tax=Flavobacterium jejuense TaxID=1544455 RepID=A0ABX0ISG2_9FLAO|nr:hypothetical protein [Flavobacterium jejuense]NHN26795.1 hypothetical protein [Flavobacterium jejuense]
MNNPYEYYNNKLGIKISFLISDKSVDAESIKVITYNALFKRMNSDTCTEKQLRRASLNHDSLIEFNSLCQEWRNRITVKFGSPKQEVKKSWFEDHFEADKKAYDFFSAHTYGDDNRKLPLDLIELYTYNASVLNTVIKLKTNRKAYARALGVNSLNIWESLSNDVNQFRKVAHKLPTSSRGLRIQVNNYLKEGYISIISGRLQNKNAQKVKENEQMALLDELLAKHTNLDNVQVCNIYNTVAERLNWKTITSQTVGNRKEEKNLVILAGRKGVNALSNKMLMQNKRKAPSMPMIYWTMDGWDAELLYQATTVDNKGYSTTTYHNRLNVVLILDPFNKYPIGYAIGERESPKLIKEALRNAFQHTKELFGNYYKPYQLQADRYQKKHLTPMYEACTVKLTLTKVKNAKSKVIEPFFNRFNREYCQMFDNWSGHNVDSGSKNQPNDEFLNKIRRSFPDKEGCRMQIITALEADRSKKREAYVNNWENVPNEYRSEMLHEMYLKALGETTGFTNSLEPDGLNVKIEGQKLCFDSFDINFRKLSHLEWAVKYDPQDTSKVLVVNAENKKGKIEEIGTYQFILQEKYVQPMALAERSEGDALELKSVNDFNKNIINYITEERQENARHLETLFQRPELSDTLAKLILVDSRGQHKDRKSDNRLAEKSKKVLEFQEIVETKSTNESWLNQQNEYNKSKINLNDYL